MPKQLYLSVAIDMPEDEFEAAAITVEVGTPWRTLLDALKASNVKHVRSCEVMDVRVKAPGAKRGRKPRAAAAPAQGTLETAP